MNQWLLAALIFVLVVHLVIHAIEDPRTAGLALLITSALFVPVVIARRKR